MLEHNDEGAMGLVLNHPLDVSLSDALSEHFNIADGGHRLFRGGPVERNALLILHNSAGYDQEHESVIPGVFVGTSPDIFEKVVDATNSPDSDFQFRIFSGYSGWGAGQLESELRRGDWFTHPATAEPVFDSNPYDVWEGVLQEFYERNRLLPDQPASPEWN